MHKASQFLDNERWLALIVWGFQFVANALLPQLLLAFLLDSLLPENSTFYIFGQPFIIQDRIQQRRVFPLSVDDRDRNGTHIRHGEYPITDTNLSES